MKPPLMRDPEAKEATQDTVSVRVGTISATTDAEGPLVPYAGRVWDSVFATVTTSTTVGTDTFTLQPQYRLEGATYNLGKPVSTLTLRVVAGVPFRCHDADLLQFRIPAGATLVLRMTRAAGSLTGLTVHFVTVGG